MSIWHRYDDKKPALEDGDAGGRIYAWAAGEHDAYIGHEHWSRPKYVATHWCRVADLHAAAPMPSEPKRETIEDASDKLFMALVQSSKYTGTEHLVISRIRRLIYAVIEQDKAASASEGRT